MNLNQIITTSGLSEDKQLALKSSFEEYAIIVEDWKKKADLIIVKDENDTLAMKEADNARKILKQKRVEVEHRRKELKEASIKEGRLIDSIANELKGLIQPIEDDLTQKAKFAEIKRKEREDALRIIRNQEINPYSEFVPYGLDLGVMMEDDYNKLLNGAKLQMQQKIEAERQAEEERIERERKAEEERIAREKAEAEERERIRKENEALREKQELGRKRRIALKEASKFLSSEVDLSELTNDEFKNVYQDCIAQLEQEQFQLEQDRLLIEKRDREIQLERERKEKELQAEREKVKKAEEEKQAIIKKQKEEGEARLRKIKEEEDAKRVEAERIANAPDIEKLKLFVDMLSNIDYPKVNYEFAISTIENAKGNIYRIIENVNETIEEISK